MRLLLPVTTGVDHIFNQHHTLCMCGMYNGSKSHPILISIHQVV